MKILKLKLRGAIGIFKGLGKEEIEIDFSQFGSGLIALTGKNGSGKTTIMENLHPYRTMVSRTGSLQSHFFLKDSYRILEFEHNGNNYESKILIDALTGGSEAYLLENGQPMNDGKLTTYDEAIERVLGSQELFFNSVFSGQKSKGIAELKPSERRKLFYELLNLNVYEKYLEQAKAELKTKELKLSEIEGQISANSAEEESYESLEKQRVETLNNIANTELAITKYEKEVEDAEKKVRDIEIKIARMEEQQKIIKENEAKLEEITEKINQLQKDFSSQVNRLNSDLEDTKKLISRNQNLVQNKKNIEENLTKIKELEQVSGAIKEKINGLDAEKLKLSEKYHSNREALYKEEKEFYFLEHNYNSKINELETLKKEFLEHQKNISIIEATPCDEATGNNCQFLTNAYEQKNKLPEEEKIISELEKECAKLKSKIGGMKSAISAKTQNLLHEYKMARNEIDEYLGALNNELKGIESELKILHATNWEELKKEAEEAGSNIKILAAKMENIQTQKTQLKNNYKIQLEDLEKEKANLIKKSDNNIGTEIAKLKDKLSLEIEKKTTGKLNLTEASNSIDNFRKTEKDIEFKLQQLAEKKKKVKELETEKQKIQNEIKDWTFLAKAFDKTGIPVLKLENSGIEITSIANELLSLFDNQFRIIFETTQLTKDKKRMKETFNINIIAGDDVVEISNLSGGQQVWVETAIQLAISLLVRQQGINIETSFLDEKDGALDIENANSYIEMIREAHKTSGVHNTFIITHRPELLDLIPQQIKLADGILSTIN